MLFDGVIIIVSYLGNNLIAATKFLNNTINSFFAFSYASFIDEILSNALICSTHCLCLFITFSFNVSSNFD